MTTTISAADACKMGIGFALGYCAYKLISSSLPLRSLIPELGNKA